MIFTKKASTEWTIGKLMTIILAVVLLVLIIYGISSGAINPLIEKTKSMFDSVLIMFNLKKNDNNSPYCRMISIDLAEGVPPFKGEFCVSEDTCELVSENGEVYFLSGNLMYVKKAGYPFLLPYSLDCLNYPLEKILFYNRFYLKALDFFTNSLEVKNPVKLYPEYKAPKSIFEKYGEDIYIKIYNEPEGLQKEWVGLYWDGKSWFKSLCMKNCENNESWRSENWDGRLRDLLENFSSIVSVGDEDEVYFQYTGMSEPKDIGKLIGGNDELESNEVDKLYNKSKQLEDELKLNSLKNKESFEKIKEKINNTFVFEGEIYNVSLIYDYPFIVVFENKKNREIYGLKMINSEEYELLKKIKGSWESVANITCYGYPAFLGEDYSAENIYKRSKIYKFLRERCW